MSRRNSSTNSAWEMEVLRSPDGQERSSSRQDDWNEAPSRPLRSSRIRRPMASIPSPTITAPPAYRTPPSPSVSLPSTLCAKEEVEELQGESNIRSPKRQPSLQSLSSTSSGPRTPSTLVGVEKHDGGYCSSPEPIKRRPDLSRWNPKSPAGVSDKTAYSQPSHVSAEATSFAASEQAQNDEQGEKKAPPRKVGVRHFARFATRKDITYNVIGIIAACAAGAGQPLMTIVFGNLATSFLRYTHVRVSSADPIVVQAAKDALQSDVNDDLLYLVYIGIATLVLTYIYMATWLYTGEVITRRIREGYFTAVLRQEVAFFDDVGAGEVTNRLEADIERIQQGISDKVPFLFVQISTFISALVVAYIRSWKLTLAMSPIVPCIMVSGIVSSTFVAKLQAGELATMAKAATIAHEALSSVRTIKTFGLENSLVTIYEAFNRQAEALGIRRAYFSGGGMSSFFFVIYSSYALAFAFGGKLVANGEIQSGIVLSVVFSILSGTSSLAVIAPNLQALGYAFSAASQVFDTIDRKPTIDASSTAGLRPATCEGCVELHDVTFRYPSRPDVKVLEKCNLTCETKKVTAFVGASGSGKSTIISLLERFYDPLEGEVLLDGIPVSSLNTQWLRSQIGLVSQEPTLFATTVRRNIEYGLLHSQWEHASAEEKDRLVRDAAKMANANDFILSLPNGYDTLLGEKGLTLSGGQKQRVAIARAIVRDPRVLLLDEATSALDRASESAVQKALLHASAGRTTINIAHRLSTIQDADKIIVMGPHHGSVIEQGTHAELLDVDGTYAGLVLAQEVQSENRRKRRAARAKGEDTSDDSDDGFSIRSRTMLREAMTTLDNTSRNFDADLSGSLKRLSWLDAEQHRKKPWLRREQVAEARRAKRRNAKRAERRRPPLEQANHSLSFLFYRLAKLNGADVWKLYLPGITGGALFGAAYPCFAILLGMTLNNFAKCQQPAGQECPQPANGDMRHKSNFYALWFFVVAILASASIFMQSTCLVRNGAGLMRTLRRKCLHKMLFLDTSYFDEDKYASGALAVSLAANASRIDGLLGLTMGVMVQALSTLITGCVVALIYGWKLALVVIACVPITLSVGLIRLKLVLHKDAKLKQAHTESSQRACETVAQIRTVAALTLEENRIRQYQEDLRGPAQMVVRMAVYGNILYAFSQSVSFYVTALAFWYGSRLLATGEYTSQQFFTIFTSVIFGSLQAGSVFNFTPDISLAKQAANDVVNLLDSETRLEREQEWIDVGGADKKSSSEASEYATKMAKRLEEGQANETVGRALSTVHGRLRLKNVHFRYPSRPDVKVLQGVDVDIAAGSTVALVGPSGCGKSTVMQLMQRLYDPDKGSVQLDGVDLQTLDPREIRKHMAVVSQEPTLFHGTIAFNILAGLESAEDDFAAMSTDEKTRRMRQAAEEANVLALIDALPNGFETNVGAAGVQLSGGQKQRIALARALIRQPKILLLDEATSALDSDSERMVQEALKRASKGRTTISVAHRLSSIVGADRIICLGDGKVVESGTHDVLMATGGAYYSLVAMHALNGA